MASAVCLQVEEWVWKRCARRGSIPQNWRKAVDGVEYASGSAHGFPPVRFGGNRRVHTGFAISPNRYPRFHNTYYYDEKYLFY
jgi:hypothetical protein